jgi:hypothetical protein
MIYQAIIANSLISSHHLLLHEIFIEVYKINSSDLLLNALRYLTPPETLPLLIFSQNYGIGGL